MGAHQDTLGGSRDAIVAKFSDTQSEINEFYNSLNISVFPNPAFDNITVIVPQKAMIEILSINGQIIETINDVDTETTICLENFSSGVYIIKAITDKEIVTRKFIKE